MLPCCHVASVDCAVVALFRCRRSFFAARFMVIAYVKNGGFVVIFFNFCIKLDMNFDYLFRSSYMPV